MASISSAPGWLRGCTPTLPLPLRASPRCQPSWWLITSQSCRRYTPVCMRQQALGWAFDPASLSHALRWAQRQRWWRWDFKNRKHLPWPGRECSRTWVNKSRITVISCFLRAVSHVWIVNAAPLSYQYVFNMMPTWLSSLQHWEKDMKLSFQADRNTVLGKRCFEFYGFYVSHQISFKLD